MGLPQLSYLPDWLGSLPQNAAGHFLCMVLHQLGTGQCVSYAPRGPWGTEGTPAPIPFLGRRPRLLPPHERASEQASESRERAMGQEHRGSFLSLHLFGFQMHGSRSPATTHSSTVPSGGHRADRDKGTEAVGRWRSHCSARGCAGLLQPQGSAQPACEVHLLPLRALDEGVVLKEARCQSWPVPQPCSGRCPWPLQWLISKPG